MGSQSRLVDVVQPFMLICRSRGGSKKETSFFRAGRAQASNAGWGEPTTLQRRKAKPEAQARKPVTSATLARFAALRYRDAPCKPTDDHVEGPFYRPDAPFLTDLYPPDAQGPLLYFDASIVDTKCSPLPEVLVEIWQADDLGHYDNDDPQHPPATGYFRCRARLRAVDGTFKLRTVLPNNYEVKEPNLPPEFPHPWIRVKHLHFKLHVARCQPLTTEIALLPDDYASPVRDPLFNPHLTVDLNALPPEGDRQAFKAGFQFVLKEISSSGYAIAAARRSDIGR